MSEYPDNLDWRLRRDLPGSLPSSRGAGAVAPHDDAFGATGSSTLRFLKLFFAFCRCGLAEGDFQDHWLDFWNQRTLTAWQFAKERQLQAMHRGLDASQGIADAAGRNSQAPPSGFPLHQMLR